MLTSSETLFPSGFGAKKEGGERLRFLPVFKRNIVFMKTECNRSSADIGVAAELGLSVLSLQQQLVQKFQPFVLSLKRLVFLGQVLVVFGGTDELLVELEERLLEYLVLLLLTELQWLFDVYPLLLQDLAAVLLFLLKDFHSQV